MSVRGSARVGAMCNLYSMTTAHEAVLRVFRVGHNRATVFEPRDAIFPGHVAPVVRMAPDGARELVTLSWGYILLREGYAPKRVTNTRDDKLDNRFWKASFAGRRCLVPATSFCEPHDDRKPATWHWFALKGEEPASAVRLRWPLAALEGAGEEGWAERRDGCLQFHDDCAECADREHQSRAFAGAAPKHGRDGHLD